MESSRNPVESSPSVEAQLCQDAYQLLNIHELLLRDAARNSTFEAAIREVVTPDSRVLDIGAGSGIWAIVAAKMGAKHVTAVEREPLLQGLIRAAAHDNGVADKVEVILGESFQVHFEEKFDVVLSETIGHAVFDEQIVPILIDARSRFLAPGGRLIPQGVALVAAPAFFDSGSRAFPAGASGDFAYFEKLALHMPVALTDRSRMRLLSVRKLLTSVDLRTATHSPSLVDLSAEWSLENAENVNCIVTWASVFLTDSISLETLDTSNWAATVYRFAAPTTASGTLSFKLTLDAATNSWTTEWRPASGEPQTHSYSPAIAATELLAQTQLSTEEFRKLKELAPIRIAYDRPL